MAHRSVVSLAARLIALLWAANTIQLGVRYSWGVALPQASAQLGLSGLESGLVASAFYVGYVLSGVPSGLLADRFGVKRVTVVGLVGVGLFSLAVAASRSFAELFLAFFAAGFVAGPIFPASLKAVSTGLGEGSRSTGVGVLETVNPAAMILAATVFPATVFGLGWRTIYLALGVAAFAVCAVYSLAFPAGPAVPREKASQRPGGVLRNRRLVWASLIRLGGMWGVIGLSSWYYYFVYEMYGAPDAQILYLALSGAAVAGQVVGGLVADRRGRATAATGGMVAFGLALILAGVMRGLVEAFVLAPAIGFAAFFWRGGLDTYILESVGPSQRGGAAGFMNTVSQLGSLAAPAAVGYAVDAAGVLSYLPILVLAAGPVASAAALAAKALDLGGEKGLGASPAAASGGRAV